MPESSLVRNALLRSAGIARALVLSRPPDYVLGPELLANPNFDSDTVWTKGIGWTISGGEAVFVAGTAGALSQTGLAVVVGRRYYSVIEFLTLTGPGAQPRLGNSPGPAGAYNLPGTFAQVITAGAGGGTFQINPTATTNAQIASVSLREIL